MMARGPDGRSGSSTDTSDMGALYRCDGPGRYTHGAVKIRSVQGRLFMQKIPSSEITPMPGYVAYQRTLSRRGLLGALAGIAGGVVAAACTPASTAADMQPAATVAADRTAAPVPTAAAPAVAATAGAASNADELGDSFTDRASVTGYNNYYEFSTDKEGVAPAAAGFAVDPWTVQVGGLVNKPATFDIGQLRKQFGEEERVYRLRCVEAWSMVIPWQGFELAKLLQAVEPQAAAKYVRFETLLDPARMPGQQQAWYSWPYVEGLRLDEAMHGLTLLATGLYGSALLPQNGAPLRLVTPWKYGFKSIKAIVKIDLVAEQPTSLWMAAAPNEYGFYANVNPQVDHPRWSQASERRIGEFSRRPTLPFNGYADEVAGLYAGMDLQANF